jgi:hypothetical protein
VLRRSGLEHSDEKKACEGRGSGQVLPSKRPAVCRPWAHANRSNAEACPIIAVDYGNVRLPVVSFEAALLLTLGRHGFEGLKECRRCNGSIQLRLRSLDRECRYARNDSGNILRWHICSPLFCANELCRSRRICLGGCQTLTARRQSLNGMQVISCKGLHPDAGLVRLSALGVPCHGNV